MKGRRIRLALLVLAILFALTGCAPARLFARTDAAEAPVVVRLEADGTRRCFRGGEPCGYTGLAADEAGESWWYAVDGTVDPAFRGFAENARGWWYVEDGRAAFERNELIEGVVDGLEGEWYVAGGRVQRGLSGLCGYTESGRLCYVEDGRVDPGFTGFARGARGWYYAENGSVDFTRTGLIRGELGGEEALWLVRGGEVQLSCCGFADAGADGDGWYLVYGRADPTLEGVVRSEEGDFFCRGGRIDRDCRDALTIDGTDWLIENGAAERVASEEQKTYFLAFRVVKSITDDSMSQEEKLRVCFDYVRDHYWECVPRIPNLQEPGWQVVYANDLLAGDGGNCLSFAATFAYMAKAVGYEEVYACNSGSHGWAEVDGRVYDPEWSRHSDGLDMYAIEYDSATGESYRRALVGCDLPGLEWIRVKL